MTDLSINTDNFWKICKFYLLYVISKSLNYKNKLRQSVTHLSDYVGMLGAGNYIGEDEALFHKAVSQ